MRILLALACLLASPFSRAAEPLPLTVLQVLDLSGPQRDTGNEFLTGARVYFDYINTRGGIQGRKISHVVADDQGLPANTLALTRQWVAQAKPVALFGYLGADNVDAVMSDRQLRTNGLAMVGPYSGLRRAEWPNLFAVRAGFDDEIRRILKMTTQLGMSRIGLEQLAQGQGAEAHAKFAEGFAARHSQHGVGAGAGGAGRFHWVT